MRTGFWLVLITYILSIGGCSVPKSQEEMKQELLDTDRAFAAYSVEHGAAEAFRQFLAENALELSANANPVSGRDNIYQQMLKAGDGYELKWEPQDGEVALGGDMGWTWGLYTLRYQTSAGENRVNYGKYLNIWKRQPDGAWRVVVDMGNQSPPPDGIS